jgi:hypothetical protein
LVNYFIFGFNFGTVGNNKVFDFKKTGFDYGIEVSLVVKLLPKAGGLLLN